MRTSAWLAAAIAGVAMLAASLGAAQPGPVSTAPEQITAGQRAYAQNCAACHGAQMQGTNLGPALAGNAFLNNWGGAQAADLLEYVASSMPPGGSGLLDKEAYVAIVAHMLAANGAPPEQPLAASNSDLEGLFVPAMQVGRLVDELGIGGVSDFTPTPPWPNEPDRLAALSPVSAEMLAEPPPEDWPAWRRSHRGLGYSPLSEINTSNVGQLRIAWAQPLPAGANMHEPLVHAGVLYTYGFGDEILALDAKTGSLLWRYRRHLPANTALTSKKTMALWGNRIYAATSDLHLIALDAKSGRPIWDKPITDKAGFRNPGGPLVAEGVVMQGLTTQEPGGGLIVALDVESGEHLWTFQTIAQPGTPDDSWNGLPAEERRGGSVWTSGSYDPESRLALWGTAQTYDTGPLLVRREGERNDALYTDATLAIVPRTGELKWFFQHMKNDQWDLDWVFDRTVATLEIEGEARRVIITSGKEGLFDVLDAETGKYLKTVDMGLQDFVTAIDPDTGEKIIDPSKLPQKDKPVFMCPHAGGGRNWSPTSFNPHTQELFVVARDVCMVMVPASPGFLSSGVNIEYAAPRDGDGKYGVLQALDMRQGMVKWEVRQRAPYDMGVLSTGGGLLFTGSVDRQVMAYDQETGRELWRSGVAGVPNASPVTYSVDGKQYVAMVVGHGNPLSFGIPTTPEIVMPPVDNSSIYVFALPDRETDP